MAQDRAKCRATVLDVVANPRFPWNAGNFSNSWGSVSYFRRNLLCGVS